MVFHEIPQTRFDMLEIPAFCGLKILFSSLERSSITQYLREMIMQSSLMTEKLDVGQIPLPSQGLLQFAFIISSSDEITLQSSSISYQGRADYLRLSLFPEGVTWFPICFEAQHRG